MGQSQRCISAAVTLQPGMLLWPSEVPVTQRVAEGECWSPALEGRTKTRTGSGGEWSRWDLCSAANSFGLVFLTDHWINSCC